MQAEVQTAGHTRTYVQAFTLQAGGHADIQANGRTGRGRERQASSEADIDKPSFLETASH